MTGSSSNLTKLEAFQVRRDMIVHEDQLINARLTLFLAVESFLITAAVILLASTRNEQDFYWLTIIIAVFAMVMSVVSHSSIRAAQLAQDYVRSAHDIYETIFPLSQDEDRWIACLQSHTMFTRIAGFSVSIAIPILTALVWLCFVYYSVRRISGNPDRAIGVSIGLVLVLIVLFGSIELLRCLEQRRR